MSFTTIIKTLAVMALVKPSIAGYALEDDYSTKNFFSMFEFFTAEDPTHGFVNFVDQGTAQSSGLISSSGGSIIMGVDHTNMSPNGRNSVRLTSNKVYNGGLIVLDLAHMPEGCGTWPAFWTTGPDWPNNGEIDIIEGVNDQNFNAMTLHTGPDCSIHENERFTGNMITPNCDVNAPDQYKNSGCSVDANGQSNTYGSGLNSAKGGVYAMDWTSKGISTYFFPRGSIPSDLTSGTPRPSGWGKPLATFSGGCDMDSKIKNQQIVFDTTFCGDWAGNAWSSSSCAAKAATCNDFVANNPSAFANAYWDINSLKVYLDDGKGDTAEPTDAGPTGIATIVGPVLSSLAPIPEYTGPAPAIALSSIGSWNQAGAGAYAAKATAQAAAPIIPAAVSQAPAPAASAPTPNVVAQAITAIGHPDWVWTTLVTQAAAPAVVTSVVPAAIVTQAVTTYVQPQPTAVEAQWFEPGGQGIPAGQVQKEKRGSRHGRHLLRHAHKRDAHF